VRNDAWCHPEPERSHRCSGESDEPLFATRLICLAKVLRYVVDLTPLPVSTNNSQGLMDPGDFCAPCQVGPRPPIHLEGRA